MVEDLSEPLDHEAAKDEQELPLPALEDDAQADLEGPVAEAEASEAAIDDTGQETATEERAFLKSPAEKPAEALAPDVFDELEPLDEGFPSPIASIETDIADEVGEPLSFSPQTMARIETTEPDGDGGIDRPARLPDSPPQRDTDDLVPLVEKLAQTLEKHREWKAECEGDHPVVETMADEAGDAMPSAPIADTPGAPAAAQPARLFDPPTGARSGASSNNDNERALREALINLHRVER